MAQFHHTLSQWQLILIPFTNICKIWWCYHFGSLITTAISMYSSRYLWILVVRFHQTLSQQLCIVTTFHINFIDWTNVSLAISESSGHFQRGRTVWICDTTNKNLSLSMMLSLWLPGRNCIEYIDFKLFMHFVGSVSANFITMTFSRINFFPWTNES